MAPQEINQDLLKKVKENLALSASNKINATRADNLPVQNSTSNTKFSSKPSTKFSNKVAKAMKNLKVIAAVVATIGVKPEAHIRDNEAYLKRQIVNGITKR